MRIWLGICTAAWVLLVVQTTWAADATPPVISHKVPDYLRSGQGVEIQATIKDESKVAFPRVYYRKPGETKYQIIEMKAAGPGHVATIPGMMVTDEGLEYYIEAFDAAGNGPTSHGLPDSPHRVVVVKAISSPESTVSDRPASRPTLLPATQPATQPVPVSATSTPWYKRWWVWTIAGVVVAGSAVAVAVATSGGEELVEVQISAPQPQPSLPGL